MRPGPQLLTYPDSLGGSIRAIGGLLRGPLAGHFAGVHVLPPYPSSGDRGFAPIDYRRIDPAFGDWSDIADLARDHDVMLDLMVNHISRRSPEFQDFEQHGRASAFADLFITLDKVWPDGDPPADDVARIFLRKPTDPFSDITITDTGTTERIWTTFGFGERVEQIDLDLASAATRRLIAGWFEWFAGHGVRIVRLDAVGYVVKKPGTSCFMVEPEIYGVLDWLVAAAAEHGIEVLPEIHDHHSTHQKLSDRGYWTYDFVLPGLLLHAFETGHVARLADHLARSPGRQFTTLDCHDGIPVRPDLDGILEPAEMTALADGVTARGGNVNRILGETTGGVDVHQLNCTYFAALGSDDDRYLAARAIQLFARGIPQLYYVGLLAGENDQAAVQRTGDGRAVNRHDYSEAEVEAALERPVVRRILELVRLRKEHPAFGGELAVTLEDSARMRLGWSHGHDSVELVVDVERGRSSVSC
ncbi:MAG: sucrose phosphorylase [Candidatus Limnocylindrales bacterium]